MLIIVAWAWRKCFPTSHLLLGRLAHYSILVCENGLYSLNEAVMTIENTVSSDF